MIVVELFSKDDCHLCDEAKEVLEKVKREIPFHLKEVKLAPGTPEYDEYKEMIPVVRVNGNLAFKYQVNTNALRRILRECLS